MKQNSNPVALSSMKVVRLIAPPVLCLKLDANVARQQLFAHYCFPRCKLGQMQIENNMVN